MNAPKRPCLFPAMAWLFATLCTSVVAIAQSRVADSASSANASERPLRVLLVEPKYQIQADGTFSEDRTYSAKVLTDKGVDRAKRSGFSFSTSVQQGEVLTAYTQKASGKVIEVGADKFQFEINRGAQPGRPAYSDRTSVSVILRMFPSATPCSSGIVSRRQSQFSTPIFRQRMSTPLMSNLTNLASSTSGLHQWH